MNEYKAGQEVCVSVQQLYNEYGGHITYGTIGMEEEYYDLFNENRQLACMDGEQCRINHVGQDMLLLKNENGWKTVCFALSKVEAATAFFLPKPKTFEDVKRIVDKFPYHTLIKNKGITILHVSGHMSIGVSYEDDDDKNEVYIFNLFWNKEYININSVGNNVATVNEIVRTWNQLVMI